MIAAEYDEKVCDPWLWCMAQRQYGRSTPWRMLRTHSRALVVVLRQLRLHSAPLIFFTGPDGCGKSTVLASVKQMLAGGVIGEPVRHRHYYSLKNVLFHITRQFWWLKSAKVPGQSGKTQSQRIDNMTVRDRDTGRGAWRLRKLLALLVGLVDIRISYLAAWWCRWRGIVVLVETSPYDVFIKYHMPEFRWVERVFAPFLPRPNLCLVLRADPHSIVSRKAELTVAEIGDFLRPRGPRHPSRGDAESRDNGVDRCLARPVVHKGGCGSNSPDRPGARRCAAGAITLARLLIEQLPIAFRRSWH
jgi:hypothetical protein